MNPLLRPAAPAASVIMTSVIVTGAALSAVPAPAAHALVPVVPAGAAQFWAPATDAGQAEARRRLPEAVNVALSHVAKRTVTSADRSALAAYPEFRVLAVPAGPARLTTGPVRAQTMPDPQPAPFLTPRRVKPRRVLCRFFEGTRETRSIFGSVVYRWKKHLDVCYDGRKVLTVNENWYRVENRDWSWYDRGLVSNDTGGIGSPTVRTYSRGQMESCLFKYGCFKANYPWVRINAQGNGTAEITAGEE